FISEETIKLGDIRINISGEFNLQFELLETCQCFADFDGYHGMIYLEPGKTYELILPPKRTLTEAQKRNPFAKSEPVWFGISKPDQNELNFQIQKFEQAYAIYENKYFDQIFINRSKSLVDTVKKILDKEFTRSNLPLFESHKLYRKANLEFALHQGKSAGFMEAYFSKGTPQYNLAAYSNLFNQVFIDYFNVLINSVKNTEIKKWIQNGSLQNLDEYFQKQLNFSKELAHWVLLKSMKDAYYSKQFSKSSILKMLDQVPKSGWTTYEQKTAQLIRSKLVYLSVGTNPPDMVLKDSKGLNIKFSDYRNSYIYLHFTDPKNTICQQHLNELKKIAAHYPEKLVIINVIPSGSTFNNNSNWSGIFTTTINNLEDSYKVKTFPNSFLIGKDGKLLLSPAPNPIDGLDRHLGQLFKSDYMRELQKNSQKTK
ncbi:MAG: hypothetical protein Q8M67_02375, partial [Bacteroidota bacterium]|nr:hypothetical protein [Bacteroidota bacterium]